jgi:hypothetical protein
MQLGTLLVRDLRVPMSYTARLGMLNGIPTLRSPRGSLRV